MDVEKEIENCKIFSKQIKQYDPDPFYVNIFLQNILIQSRKYLI